MRCPPRSPTSSRARSSGGGCARPARPRPASGARPCADGSRCPSSPGTASIELKGETVDLSEAGPARRVRGVRRAARGRRPAGPRDRAGGRRRSRPRPRSCARRPRGARWVISIRFVNIQEKDQDRVRRRVFQALREERAKQGRRRAARPPRVAGPSRGRNSGRDRSAAPPARRPDGAAGPLVAASAGAGHRRAATPPGGPPAPSSTRSTTTSCPRLRDLDAPLLTVVGGSTGAGKSTLVNSLVGAPVTTAGVLRPTTRSPVLVCARADVAAFSGDRVLPGLPRVTGARRRRRAPLQLVARDDVPAGLALLDAPDVDSVVESNRELAGQLLAAADLWVFVTTAARYADAVPWDLLRTAQERGTALAVVLDRVPPEAAAEVAADLAGMLTARRPGRAPGCSSSRSGRWSTAGCPRTRSAPLRGWLHALAADQEARAAVVRQTLTGALDSLEQRVAGVVAGGRASRRPRPSAARTPPAPPTPTACAGDRRGRAQRHAAARRGAGPLAGVRRHRRVDARAAGPGRAGCATGW